MQIKVGRTKTKRIRTETPSVSATPTPRTTVDEAQSFVRAGSPGPPSFIGVTLQNFFQDALSTVSEKLKQSNEHLMEEVNERVKCLVDSMDKNFQTIIENQEQLKHKVDHLELLVMRFSSSSHPFSSTSTLTEPQPIIPSSDVLFTVHDPLTLVLIDITFTSTTTPITSVQSSPQTAPIFQTPPSSPFFRLSFCTSQDSLVDEEIQVDTPSLPLTPIDPITTLIPYTPFHPLSYILPPPPPRIPPPPSDISFPTPLIASDDDK